MCDIFRVIVSCTCKLVYVCVSFRVSHNENLPAECVRVCEGAHAGMYLGGFVWVRERESHLVIR